MYTNQPKKMLIMNILDILRKHSDADHCLSQKDILTFLRTEYNMTAERKAIKRNLMNLLDFGYNLKYTEKVRLNHKGEKEIIYTDWYLVREFDDSELRLLIDSILFSKHIPHIQRLDLISKIEGQSSQYFKSRMRHVQTMPDNQLQNLSLFHIIDTLDEAIEKKRQIEFQYADYGTDKKQHPRLDHSGNPRKYKVNPYQMVAVNGRYYLLGNYDYFDNLSHYRLDHIQNIQLLSTPAKPLHKIEGLAHGLDLFKHMDEHIYMFGGDSARITIKTKPDMAGELIDWFGSKVTFTNENEDSVIAHVTANLKAMRFWALQYAPYVTILEPKSLVNEVRQDLKEALKKYEE